MRIAIFVLCLLVLILFSLAVIKTMPKTTVFECYVDEDCVPAQCCHATSCVPKEKAPNCENVFCTMECRNGTMDCGKGYCKCENGFCKAVIEG
ncbi:MAG: hypothetical protein J7K22_04175 [Nanoarchaeota archaeon]|nr:hypothetical protein [Nanoarchaeota archaeon]